MKLIKFLILFIIFIIGAALIAPSFISPETIKTKLIAQIESATGRSVKIDGNLHLTFFPSVGVVAEKVALSNPRESGDNTPFISLGELHVDVAVMPLLSRNVVVNNFTLTDATINLHVYKNGLKNWEFVKTEKSAATETKPDSNPPAALGLPANVNLKNVELKNGTISVIDEVKNSKLELKQINTKISLNGLNSPLKIDGSAQWQKKIVKVDAEVGTLQTLMQKQPTAVDIGINSDVMTIAAKGKIQDEIFAGNAKINTPSIKQVLSWLQPESKPIATPATLALDLQGDMNCGVAACNITNLALNLDKISAKGNLKFAMADRPNINLALDVNELDFNPFLKPAKEAANDNFIISNAVADAGHWSTAPIDLSGLRSINLNSVIHTGSIKYQKITIGKSTLDAKIMNGKLIANVVDAQLYSGTGNVSITADANGNAITSHATLKDIQLEQLLKDAANMDRLTGKANLEYSISSSGGNQQAIVSNLAGNGQIKLSDGTIQRVNLLDLLHNLQGGSDSKTTTFSNMSGTFTIAKGDIVNQDLLMNMTGMNVTGKGDINLPAYTINYRLTPQAAGKGQDGKAAGGLSVPVVISGSLDNPQFMPDVGSAIQNVLKDPTQLKNTERSVKDAFKNPKDATKNLKGLLNGLGR